MTTISTPDGLLLVDKPAGMSSHDAVLIARRATGERRIGHAGTLDPFATGLLVLLVGRATRLLPYIPGEPKVYDTTITFGAETDTEDHLGDVTRRAAAPHRAAVEAAMTQLTGSITHVPSSYSAKRVAGRRAYALARKGHDVVLEPTAIEVTSWDALAWRGDDTAALAWRGDDAAVSECDVRITCSGGTYVRALARDLGRLAESAAHVSALRRVRSGPFDVADAISIDDMRTKHVRVRPALDAVPHLPRVPVSAELTRLIVRGIAVPAAADAPVAALVNDTTGVLVALGERRDDVWQPRVVMRAASPEEVPA